MPMADLLRRTPYRNSHPRRGAEDTQVRCGVDLAARVGELMLRCGAGAPQVEGSVAAVAAAAGVDVVEVDITLQSLLCRRPAPTGTPHTLLRVVRRTRHDYARLVAVHRLVAALAGGRGRRPTRPPTGCAQIKRARASSRSPRSRSRARCSPRPSP